MSVVKQAEPQGAGVTPPIADFSQHIRIGVEEKPAPGPWFLYSLQHTLAFMAATVLMPIIVGGALRLPAAQIGEWISIVFFIAGIATIIQCTLGNRLPIVQSCSAAYVPAMIAVGASSGLGAVAYGMLVVGILEAVIGFTGLLGYVRRVFTPVVIAPTIALIGLSLLGSTTTNVSTSPLLALVTIALILFFNQGLGQRLRPLSILIGLVGGTLLAIPFGLVNFGQVASAPVFRLPTLFPWGFEVNQVAVAALGFAMMVSILESLGDYHATSVFAGVPLRPHHISRGIGTEGVGVAISSLFGGFPVTSYTVNNATIALTGVASRFVVIGAGAIGLLFGLSPLIGRLFTVIPQGVFGGAMVVLFGSILMGGLKQLERISIGPRNIAIIGTSLMLGLVFANLNPKALAGLPSILQVLLKSGMTVGAATAILLDSIIPGTDAERGLGAK
jgi:uracil-xanthine permease